MRVQDLGALGRDAFNPSVSGDVAYQHWFVVHQVLAKTRVGPSIEQVLGIVRVGHNDGLFNVIPQVSSFLDFRKLVMECPRLGEVPQRVDEVIGVSLHIEAVLRPSWPEAG